eukprot:jgi/Ulvmu1/11983/UM082_0062.1
MNLFVYDIFQRSICERFLYKSHGIIMTGSTETRAGRPSVLLVEDDRLTRTVLRHDLKLCGFDVDIAENGDVALKKLQRPCRPGTQGYDLVLTDVFMPKVDGEALVKAILNSDFRNIPVAVMSANCDDEAAERLLSIGAADYLIKPVRTSTLTRLKGLTTGRKKSVSSGDVPLRETRQTALSMGLLQAARILSSDNPETNCGATIPQQPPSPPSSTPSPTLQESSYALMSSSNATLNLCAHTGAPSDAGCVTNMPGHGCGSAAGAPSGAQVVKVATVVTDDIHKHSDFKKRPSGIPRTIRQCATFLAASGIIAPLESRKAALARFRAKKARSHFAPKVRYHERKKLAEARPRYKGQFIKVSALPKQVQTTQEPVLQRAPAASAAV